MAPYFPWDPKKNLLFFQEKFQKKKKAKKMITRVLTNFKGIARTQRFSVKRLFSSGKKDYGKDLQTVDKIEIDGKEYEIKEEPERFGQSYQDYVQELEEKKQIIEKSAFESQNIDPTEPYQVQPRALNRETELKIAQFRLQKPEEFYDHNIQGRPKGVFDFPAPDLIEKKGVIIVDEFDEDGFMVGKVRFEGSIIVFNRQVFMWDVQKPEDVRSHNFEIINLIKPRPGKLTPHALIQKRLHTDRNRWRRRRYRPN